MLSAHLLVCSSSSSCTSCWSVEHSQKPWGRPSTPNWRRPPTTELRGRAQEHLVSKHLTINLTRGYKLMSTWYDVWYVWKAWPFSGLFSSFFFFFSTTSDKQKRKNTKHTSTTVWTTYTIKKINPFKKQFSWRFQVRKCNLWK